jgi:TPR repeat protein
MMTQASVQSQYIASVQTKEDLNRVAKKEWSGRKANINKNDTKVVLKDDTKVIPKDDTKVVLKDDTKVIPKDDTKVIPKDDTKVVLKDDTKVIPKDDTKVDDKLTRAMKLYKEAQNIQDPSKKNMYIDLLKQSSDLGYVEAMYDLGVMYSIEGKTSKAIEQFQKASNSGHARSTDILNQLKKGKNNAQ